MVILGFETGKQSGKSTKCFPTERSLPRGVFETSCGTHDESSLDATSESRAPENLGKTACLPYFIARLASLNT